DGGSFLGSDKSSTISLSLSVLEYRQHHGRTYPNFRDVQCWHPNDEQHLKSLDIMHHTVLLYDKKKLFHAPVENPQRVLDIGTGTGIWAIEFADQFPSASVTGTDVSPNQPEWVPPNCRFVLEDANLEWGFSDDVFDLIHVRGLTGSINDWKKFYEEAYRCLKPGGWIEHTEASVNVTSDDGSTPAGGVYSHWTQIFIEASEKTGKTFNPNEKNEACMEAAGFTKLQTRERKMPIGCWPKDQQLKEVGYFNLMGCEEGLEGYGLWILSQLLLWSYWEMKIFFALTRAAMRDPKIHAYYPW
ncbi:S-adenosyl-L-methionine-dependent methyltransferase, partial [Lasiosphaeris hirsuta]